MRSPAAEAGNVPHGPGRRQIQILVAGGTKVCRVVQERMTRSTHQRLFLAKDRCGWRCATQVPCRLDIFRSGERRMVGMLSSKRSDAASCAFQPGRTDSLKHQILWAIWDMKSATHDLVLRRLRRGQDHRARPTSLGSHSSRPAQTCGGQSRQSRYTVY